MRRQWLLLLVAIQFLTKLPVPAAGELPQDALAESARFFPIVGAIVGLGAIGLDFLVRPHADRSVSVVLVLVYLVILTGGLHEDGLADAADGFGGGWTKDRVLAIMRDSNIGSFGALAIGCSLLARFVFLTSLSGSHLYGVLLAGQVLARWAMLPLAHWLPYARSDQGQGARVAQKTSTASLVIATVSMVLIVSLACGLGAIAMIAVACGVAALTGAYFSRRIDGITGDCLGATCQLTECAVYLTGVVL
jgi:adenosylcobinamide-GDP ribazoletransferase